MSYHIASRPSIISHHITPHSIKASYHNTSHHISIISHHINFRQHHILPHLNASDVSHHITSHHITLARSPGYLHLPTDTASRLITSLPHQDFITQHLIAKYCQSTLLSITIYQQHLPAQPQQAVVRRRCGMRMSV
jgi:hypothetical protein